MNWRRILWITLSSFVFGQSFRHILTAIDIAPAAYYDNIMSMDYRDYSPSTIMGENQSVSLWNELVNRGLNKSLRHQEKFFANKHLIYKTFGIEMLYSTVALSDKKDSYFAYILNERYAFRHIWKSGGTSVERQTGARQVKMRDVGGRKLIASVRDPLDHFLSGWQECSKRRGGRKKKFRKAAYDGQIQKWLGRVKKLATNQCSGMCNCAFHSLPQANFLIMKDNTIDPQLVMIGDLKELAGLLDVTGFRFNHSVGSGRNSTMDEIKMKYYPKQKDLISQKTLKNLCDFLALDYFLFDFELPMACK